MVFNNIVQAIDCPCCGRSIPVDITLQGELPHYVTYNGCSISTDNGYPNLDLSLKLDLEAIKEDIDKLIESEKRFEEFMDTPSWKLRGEHRDEETAGVTILGVEH